MKVRISLKDGRDLVSKEITDTDFVAITLDSDGDYQLSGYKCDCEGSCQDCHKSGCGCATDCEEGDDCVGYHDGCECWVNVMDPGGTGECEYDSEYEHEGWIIALSRIFPDYQVDFISRGNFVGIRFIDTAVAS